MRYNPNISDNITVRFREDFIVGEGSIIDDFCYFATRIEIGRFCHIANCVSVAGGGRKQKFSLGDFSSVSAGVKIWCNSADSSSLPIFVPPEITIPDNIIPGDVIIGELFGVGANSVIMPNNNIPIGVLIGALSFVPVNYPFEEWTVYAGIPIKAIKKRDKEEVLKRKALFEQKIG